MIESFIVLFSYMFKSFEGFAELCGKIKLIKEEDFQEFLSKKWCSSPRWRSLKARTFVPQSVSRSQNQIHQSEDLEANSDSELDSEITDPEYTKKLPFVASRTPVCDEGALIGYCEVRSSRLASKIHKRKLGGPQQCYCSCQRPAQKQISADGEA